MNEEDDTTISTPSDGTQEEENQTDLQDNAEHSEETTVEDQQEEQPKPSPLKEKHDDEVMTPEEIRRLKQKVSMQDRKLAELEKKTTTPQQPAVPTKELSTTQGKELDAVFRGKPDVYEAWRQKWIAEGGKDYGAYHQLYGGAPVNQGYQQNGNQNTFEAFEAYSIQKGFLTKHPEYDFKKAKDRDDGEQRYVDFNLIQDTAKKLQARAIYRGDTLSEEDAYEKAHLFLNPEKALENAKDNGRLLGKQETMLKGTGATPGLSSGASKSNVDVVLTDTDREVMKRLHISEEDMKAQKKK